MKTKLIILFYLICSLAQSVFAQTYKGIYVDGFDKILGNTVKEDSLLNYCKVNGFNAITTYKTINIEKKIKITNPKKGSIVLAAFIKRAKQQFGIISIAMSSEQFITFRDVVAVYNRTRRDSSEWVNVFNFEFEYWHKRNNLPGSYYCKKYLAPAGCSCDTSGAFKFYRKQIKSIDSLAQTMGIKSEVYVGKPTSGQAVVIANTVDRVLLDIYLKNPEKGYERAVERLNSFGTGSKKVIIIPIWGSTDEFMGEWQRNNSLDKAAKIFNSDFEKNASSAQKNISIAGFQWYKYSTMKK